MFHLRRRIAGATILAVTLGGLAACAVSPTADSSGSDSGGSTSASGDSVDCTPSADPVTLTYWSWIPGIESVVDAFNASHPNIQVQVSTIVGSEAYQLYYNAFTAGKVPDLGMVEYDRLPEFRAAGHLMDVAGCEPVAGLESKVIPFTYDQVSMGTDGIYATPTDLGTLALYYRRDIFEKYDLATPTTWATYMADAEKLKAADPAISITSFTPQDVSTLQGLVWQAGAHPYSYENDSFVLDMNSPEMDKVADYWQEMIDKGLVDTSAPPFSPALYAAWNDGTIASYIGPSWMNFTLQPNAADTAGKWGVLPLPEWTEGEASGGNWGGGGTAVFVGTEHPYEAAVFADWLSTTPEAASAMKAVLGSGQLASNAWDESGSNDAPIPFFDGQPVFQVFHESALNTDPSFQWAPDQTNINSYLQDALAGAFDGSSTIKDAFAAAQARAVTDLESQSIPVIEK